MCGGGSCDSTRVGGLWISPRLPRRRSEFTRHGGVCMRRGETLRGPADVGQHIARTVSCMGLNRQHGVASWRMNMRSDNQDRPPRNRDQELPRRKGESIESTVGSEREKERDGRAPLTEEETYEREPGDLGRSSSGEG